MKKLLLATSAIVAFALVAPAGAADLRMPVKAAPIYKPACAQFGGFWLGGHVSWVGYDHVWNDRNAWHDEVDDGLPAEVSARKSSGAGGIGIGYNWQPNCALFGIELDWDWASANAEKFHTDTGGFDTLSVSSKLKWFGTARARTGVVVDNVLIYVTGGLAWANFDRSFTLTDPGDDEQETFAYKKTRWGGVVGAGTEWQWGGGWSIRSEFLYMRFEKSDVSFTSCCFDPGDSKSFTSIDSIWTSRIGLTYRWGGELFGKGPVAARY